MGGPFTDINTIKQNMQRSSYLNEIINADNERKSAIGGGAALLPVSLGTVIQGHAFWADMQDLLERTAPSYFNHNKNGGNFEGLTGGNIPVDDPTVWEMYWQPADWQAYTGLTFTFGWPSQVRLIIGWRGAISSLPFPGRGQVERGDIISIWLFDDMIKCLDQLWWGSWPFSGSGGNRRIAVAQDSDCDDALSDQDDNWAASSWGALASQLYSVGVRAFVDGSGDTYFEGERRRFQPVFTGIWTGQDSAVDFYYQFMALPVPRSEYEDIDSYGRDEYEWHFHSSLPDDASASRQQSSYMGDISTNPISDADVGCPVGAGLGKGCYGIRHPVWKWDFANGTKP